MIKVAQEAGVKILVNRSAASLFAILQSQGLQINVLINRSSASLFAILQSQGLQINVFRGAFGSPNKFELSVDESEVTIQITGTFSSPSLSVDEATVTIA